MWTEFIAVQVGFLKSNFFKRFFGFTNVLDQYNCKQYVAISTVSTDIWTRKCFCSISSVFIFVSHDEGKIPNLSISCFCRYLEHCVVTASKWILRQGNVFTPVCLFTVGYDVTSCLAACVDSYKCLWTFMECFKHFLGLQSSLGITNVNRSHNKPLELIETI